MYAENDSVRCDVELPELARRANTNELKEAEMEDEDSYEKRGSCTGEQEELEPTVIDESSTVMLTNDGFEKESEEVNKQKGVREESEEEDEEESGHFALMKPRTWYVHCHTHQDLDPAENKLQLQC